MSDALSTHALATLNLQWCGDPIDKAAPDRRAKLADAIRQLGADTVVLTEYKAGPAGEELQSLLQQHGFGHFLAPTHMPPYKLGCAVASRHPIQITQPLSRPQSEPWRVVVFMHHGFEVYGLYVPATAPQIRTFWEWVLELAPNLLNRPCILIGDFNTGVNRVDETTYRFASHDQFLALQAHGFVDMWRHQNPDARDDTWYSSAGNGFRLDHAFASPAAAQAVTRIWLDHAPRLSGATDHSAVVLSLGNII